MSINAKVDGQTYEGIELITVGGKNITLQEVAEQATDSLVTSLLNGTKLEIEDSSVAEGYLGWLVGQQASKVSFPHMTKGYGPCNYCTIDNLLLPAMVSFGAYSGTAFQLGATFQGLKCSGVCDLSGLTTFLNMNMSFQNAVIGTLKIGAIPKVANPFGQITVTNLIFDCSNYVNAQDVTTQGSIGLILDRCKSVTNIYLPDAYYTSVKALVEAGTLTKVTNVYRMSEWSD